jgi:hypothetical protein
MHHSKPLGIECTATDYVTAPDGSRKGVLGPTRRVRLDYVEMREQKQSRTLTAAAYARDCSGATGSLRRRWSGHESAFDTVLAELVD